MTTSAADATLLHNPRCSKSREAVALLESRGVAFTVVRYLDEPLEAEAIRALASRVGGAPASLLRSKEPEYAALGLSPESPLDAVVDAIVAHPVLLERPILIVGDRAVIGRPLENLEPLLR